MCSGQSNMEYPIGSPTCWNESNINCTDKTHGVDHSQCGYGCSQNAGKEISAMENYDDGMRLFTVGGGGAENTAGRDDGRYGVAGAVEDGGKILGSVLVAL